MPKISVYINEKASQTSKEYWELELQKHLYRHQVRYITALTVDELKDSLAQDLKDETDYIFSIGGDGTANLIVQYIAYSKIKLMIIPTGTANDMASELGIVRNIDKIMKVFKHRSFKRLDLIKINDKFMMSNGGIGLAASVADTINRMRKKHGRFKSLMKRMGANIYTVFLSKMLLIDKLKMYRLKVEGEDSPLTSSEISTPLIMINNQPVVGGKFYIAPQTTNNDGKMNVTIFLHRDKLSLIKCILNILLDRSNAHDPNFISFETDQLSLSSQSGEDLCFFGDGEVLEYSNQFSIQLMPQCLEACTFLKDQAYGNTYALDKIGLV
jgi:diacylglycerol kinase family enzyme